MKQFRKSDSVAFQLGCRLLPAVRFDTIALNSFNKKGKPIANKKARYLAAPGWQK
ncbi:hypothetical protein ACVWYF_004122 [Hymenobacter sp. UYAg731]